MILTFIVCSVLFIGNDSIQLEKLKQKEIEYSQLPIVVQNIYEYEVLNIKEYRELAVSTDTKEKVDFKKYTMENIFELTKHGFTYEFKFKDKIFTLKANKGDPFVFHENKFYYTNELNLDSKNYNKVKYIEVDLVE